MEVIERVISRKSYNQRFWVRFLTDIHLGSIFCDEERLRRDVEEIRANPDMYWIGGGDSCDFINRSDKRHQESTLAPWLYGKDDIARHQIDRLGMYLEPIAGKCLGFACGNHDYTILAHYERDVYATMVNMLTRPGAPVRLGPSGFVVIRWRCGEENRVAASDVWTTTGYIEHGNSGTGSASADAAALQRLPTFYDFDFGLRGHTHFRNVIQSDHCGPSARAARIETRHQIIASGGSYLRGFVNREPGQDAVTSYSERAALPPRSSGGIVLEFCPGTREIKVIS